MKEFNAKMDKGTKILTAIVIVILLMSIVLPIVLTGITDKYEILIPIVVVLVVIFAYLVRPVKYLLQDSKLVVKKGIGSRIINLQDISEIRSVTKTDLNYGIRVFGAGDFFGYFGKFWYKNMGYVTAYVTNPEKMILITMMDDKKYLISPEEQLEFFDEINRLKK